MRIKNIAATAISGLALTASLTACGGGSGGSGVASVNGHPDPKAIAAKIGCTGYAAQSGQIELFAATEGSCSYNGDDVSILTFASSDAEKRWKDAGSAIAGNDGTTAIGNGYAVEANNADEAAAIARRVGGSTF